MSIFKTFITRGLPAVCLALVLNACGSLNKPYPEKESFGLNVPALQTTPVATPRPEILRVDRARVSAPYDDLTFVYRLSDNKFQSDYYAEFVTEPDRLITGATVRALSEAGMFKAVIEPESVIDSTLRLQIRVGELYADFRDAAHPKAVIRCRYMLLNDSLEATTVLADWRFDAAENAADATPESLAAAWGRAYATVLGKLVRAMAEQPAPGASR